MGKGKKETKKMRTEGRRRRSRKIKKRMIIRRRRLGLTMPMVTVQPIASFEAPRSSRNQKRKA